MFVLVCIIWVLGAIIIIQKHELHKARVINEVFRIYFKYNMGMILDMNKIYEDGVKWVDMPEYQ
jgi:hypothetical protein